MSLCINDDLIWISVPRCASYSKEYIDSIHAFNVTDLNLTNYKDTIQIN
jgi:hypothetical protein